MGLGFGLLSAQTRPGEEDWSRAYEETIALAVEAERLGFTSIWTTEHHFVDDGYMPSLLVVGAAVAQATSEIEIGTGVLLAPLHHPLRLAEDAATVDLIGKGRLVLGLGLGWSEIEFRAFGADLRRRGRAMDEILRILPQAWSGEVFRHRGEIFDLPELAVRPTPSRRIPIVIGGSAEPAIRRAARLADGILVNRPVDQLLDQIDWIRDECEKIGRDPAELRIMHYSVMIPGASEEEAWDRGIPHLWPMMWKYSDMEASAVRPGPPPPAPEFMSEGADRWLRNSTLVGTPEQIADRLLGIREQAGMDVEFVARSFFSTMTYDEQVEVMQQLAEGVAPHL